MITTDLTAEEWLAKESEGEFEAIAKQGTETKAWFAKVAGADTFAKRYPAHLLDTWASVERDISGGGFHPAIVPLRSVIKCSDGDLYLYDRVRGENLGGQEERKRFSALPTEDRLRVSIAICEALAAICEAGFTVVDWYEGNMIYDFEGRQIWLFDWELCRRGASFILEMDSNYGSSRLMAPEEFVRGSRIDEQTLVFNLGRFVLLNVPELAEPLAEVLSCATYPSRQGRYETVRAFVQVLIGLC